MIPGGCIYAKFPGYLTDHVLLDLGRQTLTCAKFAPYAAQCVASIETGI